MWTINKITEMIELGVEENLHLDYKSIDSLLNTDAKKMELSKDVSAFANSDGGIIIYGVKEINNKPTGFDNKPSSVNREWIENVILSSIQNKIEDLNIIPLDYENGCQVFVIEIPKSDRAPHIAKDRRYYKRYNFSSVPMEHYEIEDIRNRIIAPKVIANLGLGSDNSFEKGKSRISLTVSSETDTITDTYSVRIIVEENAVLNSSAFKLESNDFVSTKYGRLIFGNAYLRIVSPSFGHPIWKGHEINLFDFRDNVVISYMQEWSELWIVSEINIPRVVNPIINKIQIIRDGGSIEYRYT
jgi:hypothetical protein